MEDWMGRRPDHVDDLIKRIGIARTAITDKHGKGKPGISIASWMLCPVCGEGDLNYTISSYNGHIHAGCTEEGCVAWME